MPMKRLFAIVALGTVLSVPAFDQHDPNDPNDPRAHHRIRAFDQRHSRIPVYAGAQSGLPIGPFLVETTPKKTGFAVTVC
jgi:hypothetical protein